jgi:hypothetical protein
MSHSSRLDQRFNSWAKSINMEPKVLSDDLPNDMRSLLDPNEELPGWLTDQVLALFILSSISD